MTLSKETEHIHSTINKDSTKLGELKKMAKEIKKNQQMAIELWSTECYHSRLLAVLIMDKKSLTQDFIENLVTDMKIHQQDQRNQIADWLLANRLMKDKNTTKLLETWEKHPLALMRRLFWYHQARLRWSGKTPPDNTADLMFSLEKDMAKSEPEVQWAMNFCAGQIGIHEPEYQTRCIELGERLGLYKDEPVTAGCVPNYLPEFIRIEFGKIKK